MMLNKVEEILVYWEKEGYFYGRTRNFKEVFFLSTPQSLPKIWDLVKVKIKELDKYVLKGEIVS
jgi:tRNA A37 methylthiotransferase MiaB